MIEEKNSIGGKSDYRRISHTRLLTRIITFLSQEEVIASQTDIFLFCCSSKNKIRDALLWLLNNKIIKLYILNSKKYYYINPEWEDLK